MYRRNHYNLLFKKKNIKIILIILKPITLTLKNTQILIYQYSLVKIARLICSWNKKGDLDLDTRFDIKLTLKEKWFIIIYK